MKFELRKTVKATAEGEEVYYCTYMDGSYVDDTTALNEAEGKALYMLAIEHKGQMSRVEILHSMEVENADS
tara:strand:- start:84 stop:296 length:213 start_codon:yes stop_codon:yes gene_type:complete